jgi:hypothetical protein
MTLGGAMTISAAAASPNMGYHSSALLTTIMTLFNARLGAWLGNPSKPNSSAWQKNGPVFGGRSYIDELLGLTNESSNWVYLSDGGHFENLGIYEMIVRRCHTIIVVDGGCDPDYTFEDLANAVRKIRIDLGVPIEFANGVAIKKDPDNHHHWAIGTIKYSAVDGTPEKEDGRLIIDLPLPDPTRRTRCLGVLWAIGSKSRKPRLPMTTPTTSSAAAIKPQNSECAVSDPEEGDRSA